MTRKRKKEKEIYYLYADTMYALCYRYLKDKELSEEILNNGFLKVFKNLNNFSPQNENSLQNWIKKIIINECLMHLRKKNILKSVNIESIPELNIGFSEIELDSDQYILDLLHNLPEGYRTIFNLYVIEGYSHKEIADKLNIKESTSRSQLSMARKHLKEILIKNDHLWKQTI